MFLQAKVKVAAIHNFEMRSMRLLDLNVPTICNKAAQNSVI